MKQVIKRDGKNENFDEINIRKVIKKANASVSKEHQISEETIEKVLQYVLQNIQNE